MDILAIVIIAMGAVNVLAGLASIFTGRVYMMGSPERYTDESLRKFALPLGIMNVLSGAGFIMMETLKQPMFTINGAPIAAGLVLMLAAIVLGSIVYMAGRKVLVKKACEC